MVKGTSDQILVVVLIMIRPLRELGKLWQSGYVVAKDSLIEVMFCPVRDLYSLSALVSR